MSRSHHKSFSLAGWLIIGCILLVPVLTGAQTPSPSPSPSQSPTPDPAAAKVEAVTNAIAEAEKAIKASNEREQQARSSAGRMGICRPPEASDPRLIEYQQLADEIIDVSSGTLLKTPDVDLAALTTAQTKVTNTKGALPTATPVHDNVKAADTAAAAELEKLQKQINAITEVKKTLREAALNGFTCAEGLTASMTKKIAPLKALPGDAGTDVILPVLTRSLSDLALVSRLKGRVLEIWKSDKLQTALGPATAGSDGLGLKTTAELTTVTTSLNTVDSDVAAIGAKLKTWLATIAKSAADKQTTLGTLLQKVITEPERYSGEALSETRAATRLVAELTQLGESLAALRVHLRGVIGESDLRAAMDQADLLQQEVRRLGVGVTLVQDGMGGSFAKFEADQVSLFYFTDVPRLMKALNPATFEMGGLADAREQASQAARELATAELALVNSQGDVNTLQHRLEDLSEELRVANAQFLSADGLLTTASRKLEELRARPNLDQRKITQAEQHKTDLQAESDAAKQRQDDLTDEQSGLPAKISAARDELVKAQKKVSDSRSSIIRLAMVESEAFARARDNTPFFVAMPIAVSTDPAKRVLLYAFNDSKTLFMRGNPGDLEVVRDIVSRFDRPSPQARMTLWSLELNSTADKEGTKRFNRALESIEAELANTRARISTSLSFLRDSINEEVNRVALLKLEELRQQRAANEVLSPTPQDAADLYWARLHFYQPEVLMRLGFDANSFEPQKSVELARFMLPDPSATTTLGEALMVLSLGKIDSRWAIANGFRSGINRRIKALDLADTIVNRNAPPTHIQNDATSPFAFMFRAMGLDLNPIQPFVILPVAPAAGAPPVTPVVLDSRFAYSSTQQEIVRAIKADAVSKLEERFRELRGSLERVLEAAKSATTPAEVNKVERERQRAVNEILPILAWLRNEMGLNLELPGSDSRSRISFNLEQKLEAQKTAPKMTPKLNADVEKAVTQYQVLIEGNLKATNAASAAVKGLNPSRKATARVAAADQMLKEMIIAVEDDLDRQFVQPMMLRLRDGLVKEYKGIGVGLIQRTSVLGANRTLARVEARGSAQLALGEETDILEGIQQIANLIKSGQTAGALGILGGLNALPRKNTAELYGLTTGGTFKVTPIFDPSGQAMRFQLDQVSATMVREPDGTTNPQLPRVERHTVNTEVQLSNLELREVSRFNANARLGLPERTWGGLPLFNSYPWIRRNLPLIGWFVRKRGDAPFVQQSLIFGQTTMYPTIGDLMDLLRNSDSQGSAELDGQRLGAESPQK